VRLVVDDREVIDAALLGKQKRGARHLRHLKRSGVAVEGHDRALEAMLGLLVRDTDDQVLPEEGGLAHLQPSRLVLDEIDQKARRPPP